MRIAASCVSLLGLLGLADSQNVSLTPTACPVGVSARNVSSTAEALELSDALLCSGPGQFQVEWSGEVLLTRTIAIPNGHSLKVSGLGEAIIDGGGAVRLFEVVNGSTLELHRVSLVRGGPDNDGSSLDYGGAVLISDSSQLTATESSFSYNNATVSGGAIYVEDSDVTVVEAIFAANAAGDSGGSIFSRTSEVTIRGTAFTNNSAADGGGAVASYRSSVAIGGDTTFVGNSAGNADKSGYDTPVPAVTLPPLPSTSTRAPSITLPPLPSTSTRAPFDSSSWLPGGDQTTSTPSVSSFSYDSVTQSASYTFSTSSSLSFGGAIFSNAGNVTIKGNATFADNSAETSGGGISCWGGNLAVDGKVFFGNNFGRSGGAIEFYLANLTIDGEATFSDNTAALGGAIVVNGGQATLDGQVLFDNNTAGIDGGAIFCDGDVRNRVSMNGLVIFANNSAGRSGGAIYSEQTRITIDGDTNFANNSAARDGGAIAMDTDCYLNIAGPTSFLYNTAQEDGGAIAVHDTNVLAQQATIFMGNRAISGAGGGAYCSTSIISFEGSEFMANEAVWGGGMALFSSGSVWNKDFPNDSGSANMTLCVFERNEASEGGAIYSAAGYDTINTTSFEGNLAAISGGAYLHSGVLVQLDHSAFVGNRAGATGPAISSLGVAESITNTFFESNTYHCPPGQYGYDMAGNEDEDSGTCRFAEVCAGCAASCGEILESVDVVNDSDVPTCVTATKGVDASGGGGMTLSMLHLESGYYRTSVESQDILKCHREEACVGGVEISQYCKRGYHGPYCAICNEGYASGYQYSCSSCKGETKRSAMGMSIALLLVALVVIVLVIMDIIRVVDDDGTDTATTWEKKLTSYRDRIAKIVPLTSIKIVVVAWQIITQFSSVVNVVYPDVYERFLSTLNLVNLNIGFILSVSCIVNTSFYSRLFFVTIGPLIVVGILLATYAVARSRNRHSPAGIQAAKHKHLSIGLFMVFVIYSSVSFTVFQTFACETLDDGVHYLRADYSLTCSTSMHTAMKAYAGVMILVYPVGVPAFFAWWLMSNRHDLVNVGDAGASGDAAKSLDHLQPMRDLWAPYQPRRYYFEVVECGRRIALTGLAVFLFPGTAAQVALEVVLAAVFIGISEKLSPFVDPLDAWLYRCGTWVVFFTMYLGLLLKVDASDEDSQSQAVFANILIAAHVCMIFMVVVQAVLTFRRGLVAIRDQPVSAKVSRNPSCAQVCDGDREDAVEGEAEPEWSKEA